LFLRTTCSTRSKGN